MENYDDWLAAVNDICEAAYGFDSTHFPEADYKGYFRDGVTPCEVVYELLPEAEHMLKAFRVHPDDREKYPILRGRINAREGAA